MVANYFYEKGPESLQASVFNLRKSYTFTVGRLAWQTTNLSAKFHADCKAEGHRCTGLYYELEDSKVLVAGDTALPLSLLPTPAAFGSPGGFMKLVEVIEPPTDPDVTRVSPYRPGDFLLPHNMNRTRWDVNDTLKGFNCSIWVENRAHNVLNNHLYIEHPLQPSYTAAMFFLLQDATTREVIPLPDNRMSLTFDDNIHIIALRLRIPRQNMKLTLISCGPLGLGALGVVLYSWRLNHASDALLNVSNLHVVTQVLLDESKFPPLLLQRRLVDRLDNKRVREDIEAYLIRAVSLQHHSNNTESVNFQVQVTNHSDPPMSSSASSNPPTSDGSTQEEGVGGEV